MKQAFITYAAVLQIVAILLLQFYQIAPHFGYKAARPQCRGNHAQCGCSPERIAAHTCCCNQRKPECCDKEKGHEEEQVARRDGKPSAPYLCTAPCGGTPKFITASLDKLKFLRPEVLPLAPAAHSHAFPFPGTETAASRFREPPIPPPKPLFLS